MSEGIDVSEWQQPFGQFWWSQWDFGIIRVHSGFRADLRWKAHVDDARAAKKPIGFYGYVVGQRPVWQAEQLVELTNGLEPELGWWSDFEDPTVDRAACKAHVDRLRELVPSRHGVYSNIGDYQKYLTGIADDLSWWMADYGPNDGKRHDPFEQPPVPSRGWLIHQFSSAGGLDRNYAEVLPVPTPTPKECHMYIVRQKEGGAPFKHTGGRLVTIDSAEYDALIKAGVVEVPAWPASEIQAEQAALARSGAAGGWTTATLTGKITVP